MDALNSEVERGLAWASCGPIVKYCKFYYHCLIYILVLIAGLVLDLERGSTAAET
jgi:hypothetical protein